MREKDVDIGYALLAHKIIITFGFSHKDLNRTIWNKKD